MPAVSPFGAVDPWIAIAWNGALNLRTLKSHIMCLSEAELHELTRELCDLMLAIRLEMAVRHEVGAQ
jgi:hypothetical protein